MTYGVCWASACQRDDTRLYLSGPACDDHAPWAHAGRPDPRTQIDPARTDRAMRVMPTPMYAKGGSDLDKLKPGGYMSRQRAVKIAEQRDATRARQSKNNLIPPKEDDAT